jgi:hypothetical protein
MREKMWKDKKNISFKHGKNLIFTTLPDRLILLITYDKNKYNIKISPHGKNWRYRCRYNRIVFCP